MSKDDRLLIGLVAGLTFLWALAGVFAAFSLADRPCVCADGKVMFPSGGTGKIK